MYNQSQEDKRLKKCSVKDLFSSDNYVIPIYQRNYAWGEAEITQLIQDIVDYLIKDESSKYYIGTLIVLERGSNELFEIIDGQQRLTTLSILLSFIKNREKDNKNIDTSWYKEMNLTFDSREKSTKTLKALFSGGLSENIDDYTISIKSGYDIVEKSLNRILNDNKNLTDIDRFCEYLFNHVQILRVLVPQGTDLNHYFEIMNNRGEQLEQHEILKARCLEVFNKPEDKEDKYAFNLIWEACSNMEKYVQYGFSIDQRNTIFGNGDTDNLGDVFTLQEKKNQNDESQSNQENISLTIKELLDQKTKSFSAKKISDNENPERFNSIINFPNFLLHILKIQTQEDIALDDKRLVELFKPFLKDENNKKEFVKQFGYNLLKGKFLFDKYIIKRVFLDGEDKWNLQRLKWYETSKSYGYVNTFSKDEQENDNDINREILMLLSMFQVSFPTQAYKHWLNGALKYLFENENTTAEDYKDYLENLAKAFLNDRFLAKEPKDYFEIIYTNNGILQNKIDANDTLIDKKLNAGTAVENFIFNYLDYLLWQDYCSSDKEKYFKLSNKNVIDDNRIRYFEFTYRSSVEHYYPQHPIGAIGGDPIDDSDLNNFGNLCLISSSKNSKLSNYLPTAKKEQYNLSTSIDSIKQRIMMEYDEWNTSEIKEHGERMKNILKK